MWYTCTYSIMSDQSNIERIDTVLNFMTPKRSFTLVFIIYRMTLFYVNHSFYWCANIAESHMMLLKRTTWCFKHSLLVNMYIVYANEASFGREVPLDLGS